MTPHTTCAGLPDLRRRSLNLEKTCRSTSARGSILLSVSAFATWLSSTHAGRAQTIVDFIKAASKCPGAFALASDWANRSPESPLLRLILNRSQHLLVFNYCETSETHAPFSLHFPLPQAPVNCSAPNRQFHTWGLPFAEGNCQAVGPVDPSSDGRPGRPIANGLH